MKGGAQLFASILVSVRYWLAWGAHASPQRPRVSLAGVPAGQRIRNQVDNMRRKSDDSNGSLQLRRALSRSAAGTPPLQNVRSAFQKDGALRLSGTPRSVQNPNDS